MSGSVVERLKDEFPLYNETDTLPAVPKPFMVLTAREARLLLAAVEALENLLDSIPPRHARDSEIEAWELAQDKASKALEALKTEGE